MISILGKVASGKNMILTSRTSTNVVMQYEDYYIGNGSSQGFGGILVASNQKVYILL